MVNTARERFGKILGVGPADVDATLLQRVPMGRFLQPEEIAHLAGLPCFAGVGGDGRPDHDHLGRPDRRLSREEEWPMTTMGKMDSPFTTEIADGVYAYIQPDGSWFLNNTGIIVGPETTVMVDQTSTVDRGRALMKTVDEIGGGKPVSG